MIERIQQNHSYKTPYNALNFFVNIPFNLLTLRLDSSKPPSQAPYTDLTLQQTLRPITMGFFSVLNSMVTWAWLPFVFSLIEALALCASGWPDPSAMSLFLGSVVAWMWWIFISVGIPALACIGSICLVVTFLPARYLPFETRDAATLATMNVSPADAISAILTDAVAPRGEQCSICRDDFTRPVSVPCGHVYCETCIRGALSMRNTCPLCSRVFFRSLDGMVAATDFL